MSGLQKTRPVISAIDQDTWRSSKYDMAVFALGFESRSICFVEDVAKSTDRPIAYGFDHGHDKAYKSNVDRFADAGVSVQDSLSDEGFELALKTSLGLVADDTCRKIFVDISCFTRFRLAAIVHEIFEAATSRTNDLVIDFAYALAKFERPSSESRPNTIVGPAHRAFAGWSQGGYFSTAAVLGLGYEQDQAMGVVEYLQAGEVWAFTPNSPVPEYKPAVRKANDLLLSELAPNHVIEYDVCSPASVIATLESVVRGLGDEHSVVLVPFGPKVFVLCCLIVAAIRQDVAVWRVSQGSRIEPHDRVPSDVRIGVRLTFPGANLRAE